MKKFNKNSIATMIGAAVVSSFTGNVNAETTPFAMNELATGYKQAAPAPKATPVVNNKTAAKPVATPAAGKTGGTCAEGKCGDMMKPAAAAATAPAKAEEGKCGEAKCGAMMENGKMKAGMEMACGAMMKGKEGSCGDMMNMSAPAAAHAEHAEHAEHAAAPAPQAAAPAKAAEMACGAMMKGKEGSCGEMSPMHAAPAPAPVAAAPAPVQHAQHAAPAAAPAKPAAAPAATANKVVEGQCAAVKEISHDAPEHAANGKAQPWGNRKKIVNP